MGATALVQRPALIVGGERYNRLGPIPHPQAKIIALEESEAHKLHELARRGVSRGQGKEALNRCGEIFEHLLRQLLIEQHFRVDPRRSVVFMAPNESGEWKRQSREFDALLLDEHGEPDTVVEVRTSVQGMRHFNKKKFQLATTLNVMRSEWTHARGLVVFIAIGPEPVRTNPTNILDGLHFRLPQLERALRWSGKRLEEPDFPVAVIRIERIVEWAKTRGWWFNPTLLREARRFAEHRWSKRLARQPARLRLH